MKPEELFGGRAYGFGDWIITVAREAFLRAAAAAKGQPGEKKQKTREEKGASPPRIANGAASGIALTLFQLINEVTDAL